MLSKEVHWMDYTKNGISYKTIKANKKLDAFLEDEEED